MYKTWSRYVLHRMTAALENLTIDSARHRVVNLSLSYRMVFCFYRFAGQVAKASAPRAADRGIDSRLRLDFSGSSHTSDLKIGTPVATLPDAWRYRVRAGTGLPGVSILWLGEMESLVCSFLSQCGSTQNCQSRSVPEIHWHVAGTLSN